MTDRGTAPKHVDFYSKNKFKKLVHLVGFIIRVYHDARSSERQKCCNIYVNFCGTIKIVLPTEQDLVL